MKNKSIRAGDLVRFNRRNDDIAFKTESFWYITEPRVGNEFSGWYHRIKNGTVGIVINEAYRDRNVTYVKVLVNTNIVLTFFYDLEVIS